MVGPQDYNKDKMRYHKQDVNRWDAYRTISPYLQQTFLPENNNNKTKQTRQKDLSVVAKGYSWCFQIESKEIPQTWANLSRNIYSEQWATKLDWNMALRSGFRCLVVLQSKPSTSLPRKSKQGYHYGKQCMSMMLPDSTLCLYFHKYDCWCSLKVSKTITCKELCLIKIIYCELTWSFLMALTLSAMPPQFCLLLKTHIKLLLLFEVVATPVYLCSFALSTLGDSHCKSFWGWG